MSNFYLEYYKQINAQKQIENLAKKYKNKKIVIYGAGIMTKTLFENFDFSKLNIIAICDNKYKVNSEERFFAYKTINPKELTTLDYDIIFVNLRKNNTFINKIKYRLIINSKNENKQVKALIEPTWQFLIKQVIS